MLLICSKSEENKNGKNGVLEKSSRKIQNKGSLWKSLVKKVAGYRLVKKRLRHKCFPVDFAKFLRTPILKSLHQVAVNNNSK